MCRNEVVTTTNHKIYVQVRNFTGSILPFCNLSPADWPIRLLPTATAQHPQPQPQHNAARRKQGGGGAVGNCLFLWLYILQLAFYVYWNDCGNWNVFHCATLTRSGPNESGMERGRRRVRERKRAHSHTHTGSANKCHFWLTNRIKSSNWQPEQNHISMQMQITR